MHVHHLYPIHRLLLYCLRSHYSTLPIVNYSMTISLTPLYILPVGDNDRGLTTIIIKNNKITMKKEEEEAEEEEIPLDIMLLLLQRYLLSQQH